LYDHPLTINREAVERKVKETTETRELLEKYSKWLEKHGYIDSDYYTEEPNAIDTFLESLT